MNMGVPLYEVVGYTRGQDHYCSNCMDADEADAALYRESEVDYQPHCIQCGAAIDVKVLGGSDDNSA